MKTLLVVSAIFFVGKIYAQENAVDNSVKYGDKHALDNGYRVLL